jgi:hypothetical protein
MCTQNWKEIEAEVWQSVQSLENNPAARIQSRKTFYRKYGQGTLLEPYGFGDSEIAFMGWEKRSVLNSLGSAWWSALNLWFIFLSESGAKAYELGWNPAELPITVQFWRDFLSQPSATSWYRAHNSSIIEGYLKYADLAILESEAEKIFINKVLYRLLFAQSWVEGEGFFSCFSKMFANPRGYAVAFITRIDAFYPSHYPMTEQEARYMFGTACNLRALGVYMLDNMLIEPQITVLYQKASVWNSQPELNKWIYNNKAIYPI